MVGAALADGAGDVVDGDAVDGQAVDGLKQMAGWSGKLVQFKCFGQGSLIMVKYLKQHEKTPWQTEQHGKRGGISRWLVQNER